MYIYTYKYIYVDRRVRGVNPKPDVRRARLAQHAGARNMYFHMYIYICRCVCIDI